MSNAVAGTATGAAQVAMLLVLPPAPAADVDTSTVSVSEVGTVDVAVLFAGGSAADCSSPESSESSTTCAAGFGFDQSSRKLSVSTSLKKSSRIPYYTKSQINAQSCTRFM